MKSARFDSAASASNWLVAHLPPSCFECWMRRLRPWTLLSPAAAATATNTATTCSTVPWRGSTQSFVGDFPGMSAEFEAIAVAHPLHLASRRLAPNETGPHSRRLRRG